MEIVLGILIAGALAFWVYRRKTRIREPQLNIFETPLSLRSKAELLDYAVSLGLDPKALQQLDRDEILRILLEKQGDL